MPLLIILAAFDGNINSTSLAAIGITALAGTILGRRRCHAGYAPLVCPPPRAPTGPRSTHLLGLVRSHSTAYRCCALASPPVGRRPRHPARSCWPARGLLRGRRRILFCCRWRSGCRRSRRRPRPACRPCSGTWRQRHYGNVRWRTALALSSLIAGAAAGVQIATALPEDVWPASQCCCSGQRFPHGACAAPPLILRNQASDEIWLPLVDEPIGSIVADPGRVTTQIEALGSPRRIRVPDVRVHPGRREARRVAGRERDAAQLRHRQLNRAPSARRRTGTIARGRYAPSPRRSPATRATARTSSSGRIRWPATVSASSPSSTASATRLTAKIAAKPATVSATRFTDGCSWAWGRRGAHKEEEAGGVDGPGPVPPRAIESAEPTIAPAGAAASMANATRRALQRSTKPHRVQPVGEIGASMTKTSSPASIGRRRARSRDRR